MKYSKYDLGFEKQYLVELYRPSDGAKINLNSIAWREEQEIMILLRIKQYIDDGFLIIGWIEKWVDGIPF